MKNNRPFFPGRHQASAGENLKLKAEIHQVTEPPLIDCCIYELNAVWLRYQFLLRRFKLLERLDF